MESNLKKLIANQNQNNIQVPIKEVISQAGLIKNCSATMKLFLTLLVLGSTISLSTPVTPRHSVPDYYWRDFTGPIPNDAIIGGKTENGEATFIGQMSTVDNKHLPGTIMRGKLSMDGVDGYVGNYHVLKSQPNSNPKILCSQNRARYSWSSNTKIGFDCSYVVVGHEFSIPLYVGRFVYQNRTVTGKAFSDNRGDENLEYLYVPNGFNIITTKRYAYLLYCS